MLVTWFEIDKVDLLDLLDLYLSATKFITDPAPTVREVDVGR